MEDARKLLDSLMGHSRDQDVDEAKKKKGLNFTGPEVCKHYLLGFCPQHELGHGKITRRNLGECHKAHSDAMQAEYEAHPEKEKYQVEYEKALIPVLESCVREADSWVARERANAQKAEQVAKDKSGSNTMPAAVRENLAQLNEDVDKMMAAAEKLAEQGDIDSSKFKVILAEEIKAKVKEIEATHSDCKIVIREEWVCDVCGTRTEAATPENNTRYQAHFTGQVHLGYLKIREWVKTLREKQRGFEEGSSRGTRDGEREGRKNRSRSGGGDDRRRRDRSRSKDTREAKPRSPERERENNRKADNRDRDAPRDDNRDRDGRRGGNRRDENRDRDGGREGERESYRRRSPKKDDRRGDRRSPPRDDRRGDRRSPARDDRRADRRSPPQDEWRSQSWGESGRRW